VGLSGEEGLSRPAAAGPRKDRQIGNAKGPGVPGPLRVQLRLGAELREVGIVHKAV